MALSTESLSQTRGAKFLHCGRTAGTCIKEDPKEKEETSSEAKADAATQQSNLILTSSKSSVLTIINPNCNCAKAYKRGNWEGASPYPQLERGQSTSPTGKRPPKTVGATRGHGSTPT